MTLRGIRALLVAVLLASPFSSHGGQGAFEPLEFDRGATGLGLALRRLGTTARVLYVTAHPDDEHNGILVRLSRGLGVRTALLTVTRGEGGQNAIGPELFEALGVLRTGELLALHRYDGVEQYFGRAYEFGYSFSVEETFAKWGREETLGDIVRVIRRFRPDVILALPLAGEGGGQHHFAAAQLAQAAFRAAADPARFPDPALPPWQARKLYEGGIGGFGGEEPKTSAVRVPTGEYDPLLGMTWLQLGARSRTMHRSQGASQIASDLPPAEGRFRLVDAEPAVTDREADFLDGVDTSFGGLARFAPGNAMLAARLGALQARATAARAAFDPRAPEAAVPALTAALTEIRSLRGELAGVVPDARGRGELESRLADEERDAEAALALAHGLGLEANADDGLATPGQSVGVTVTLVDPSTPAYELQSLELEAPPGWTIERRDDGRTPASSTARRARFVVTLPADARPSQPYWRKQKDHDRHDLLVPADESLPFSPPPVVARARLSVSGVATSVSAPVVWRYEGRVVGGERRHELTVVPELSIRLSPDIAAIPLTGPRRPLEVRAAVRSFSKKAAPAEVRLELPQGFTADPPSVPLTFAVEGEEATARFRVTPPAALATGTLAIHAVATREGRAARDTVQAIDYDHVERRQLVRPAETRLLALDVKIAPGSVVGYVMGSGDALAEAIGQLGVPLTLLTADDLLFSDLGRYTTIVTGIRAYETRPDLRSAHGRLMRWAEAGGHLVVQYNRNSMNRLAPEAPAPPADAPSPYVPYPAQLTVERISDETAPLTVLAPHPLLSTPNPIGTADWTGWVQERGIQLLSEKDPRYHELLAATDPFPYNPGEKRGLLVDAAVGKGSWTYVGLALFRQVPAGVPGAWRLLANLVSRPRPASGAPRKAAAR